MSEDRCGNCGELNPLDARFCNHCGVRKQNVSEQRSNLIPQRLRLVSKDDVTVVLPVLNEKEAIGHVLNELREYGYHNLLVVDGYSSDGTPEIARGMGARVVGQIGEGKSGALAAAVRLVETPYLVVMDGDSTYSPSCIERMLTHASACDEVIGARSNGRQNIPLINRLGNLLLSRFFSVLFGVGLSDVCSGMYLLRTSSAKRLEFRTRGFDVEVEIAAQIASNDHIIEVPIDYRSRLGKRKLSSLRHGTGIASSMLRLAHRYNPVLLYSGFVALASVPAGAILAWVFYEQWVHNIFHSGFALFGVMLFLLATQAFAVASMAAMIKRSERRLTSRRPFEHYHD